VQTPRANRPPIRTVQGTSVIGVPVGVGVGVGLGLGVGVGVGLGVGVGVGLGLGLGLGVGVGVPASQSLNVIPSPEVGAPVVMLVTATSDALPQAFQVQARTERPCCVAQGRKVGK